MNEDDDHAYEKPVWGVAGWTKDGKSVLLYDKYDVWQLPLDGAQAGEPHGRRRRGRSRSSSASCGSARVAAAAAAVAAADAAAAARREEEGIDLSKPLTLSAYGDCTKKSGYWQVDGRAGAQSRSSGPTRKSAGAQKAENADRVIFTEQTFSEFPDYWVSDASFASPRKVTDANPIIKEYAWGTKVLIDYTNSKGQKLQATLTLPAGYQPGKKYPMLVYFYEIMSNTHHKFSMPVFDDRPHMSTYASNGYLVFQPDVVYEIGKPGTSAVDCVTSGVKKVIELGYADPKHIGLQGHSWGGYQSSYIVTQTDMFAAVVTGAPPTDLISFYDELYKQTGTVQQGITEVGQVRMGANVTPWTAKELYEEQSPLFNVHKIKTPFMILQGTADGAVDWDQGLEFYNAARRNGKQVIFLSYPERAASPGEEGEPEGLPDAHEAVLRSLPEGRAGAEVDDRRRAADDEGRTDQVKAIPVMSSRPALAAAFAAAVLVAAAGRAPLLAQQPALTPDQQYAHDVYKELIETNSSTMTSGTTVAAQEVAKRFRDAGFPESDIFLGGVRPDKFNVVLRYHGSGGPAVRSRCCCSRTSTSSRRSRPTGRPTSTRSSSSSATATTTAAAPRTTRRWPRSSSPTSSG